MTTIPAPVARRRPSNAVIAGAVATVGLTALLVTVDVPSSTAPAGPAEVETFPDWRTYVEAGSASTAATAVSPSASTYVEDYYFEPGPELGAATAVSPSASTYIEDFYFTPGPVASGSGEEGLTQGQQADAARLTAQAQAWEAGVGSGTSPIVPGSIR